MIEVNNNHNLWQLSVNQQIELLKGDGLVFRDEDLTENLQRWDDAANQPRWLVLEECSFGTLSILYKSLRNPSHKRVVADVYGLSSQVMESWLHALVYVRNICAHHARLWNRDLRISPLIPRNLTLPFLTFRVQNDRAYYVLSIILYFLQTINPANAFVSELQSLLTRHPSIELQLMGFPAEWEQEPLWIISH